MHDQSMIVSFCVCSIIAYQNDCCVLSLSKQRSAKQRTTRHGPILIHSDSFSSFLLYFRLSPSSRSAWLVLWCLQQRCTTISGVLASCYIWGTMEILTWLWKRTQNSSSAIRRMSCWLYPPWPFSFPSLRWSSRLQALKAAARQALSLLKRDRYV